MECNQVVFRDFFVWFENVWNSVKSSRGKFGQPAINEMSFLTFAKKGLIEPNQAVFENGDRFWANRCYENRQLELAGSGVMPFRC